MVIEFLFVVPSPCFFPNNSTLAKYDMCKTTKLPRLVRKHCNLCIQVLVANEIWVLIFASSLTNTPLPVWVCQRPLLSMRPFDLQWQNQRITKHSYNYKDSQRKEKPFQHTTIGHVIQLSQSKIRYTLSHDGDFVFASFYTNVDPCCHVSEPQTSHPPPSPQASQSSRQLHWCCRSCYAPSLGNTEMAWRQLRWPPLFSPLDTRGKNNSRCCLTLHLFLTKFLKKGHSSKNIQKWPVSVLPKKTLRLCEPTKNGLSGSPTKLGVPTNSSTAKSLESPGPPRACPKTARSSRATFTLCFDLLPRATKTWSCRYRYSDILYESLWYSLHLGGKCHVWHIVDRFCGSGWSE